ncbi:MAG: retroviral-like aspartic protease [Acidobacteriota bacterium]|nr:retroviral-like aspartic protease [Acidobacteriota bacterium]
MQSVERFDFKGVPSNFGTEILMPLLPVRLIADQHELEVLGLLDSGSAINVLPFSLGLALGGVWKREKAKLRLTGNLAASPAMPFVVHAQVGRLPAVELVFAWTQNDSVQPIFGQINFFDEFDVCLHRSRKEIEIRTKL